MKKIFGSKTLSDILKVIIIGILSTITFFAIDIRDNTKYIQPQKDASQDKDILRVDNKVNGNDSLQNDKNKALNYRVDNLNDVIVPKLVEIVDKLGQHDDQFWIIQKSNKELEKFNEYLKEKAKAVMVNEELPNMTPMDYIEDDEPIHDYINYGNDFRITNDTNKTVSDTLDNIFIYTGSFVGLNSDLKIFLKCLVN